MKRLIIGPAWVGDMVMAQALAKRLKRLDPHSEIHMIAPSATLPVVNSMPEVAKGWLLDIAHGRLEIGKRWRLARALRAERFDEALVLPRSFKAALIPFLAGIPRRKGARGEFRYGLINEIVDFNRAAGRTVEEFLRFAGAEPMREAERPALTATLEAGALARLGFAPGERYVALCPGAEYGPAKRWPPIHFAELARRLARQGFTSAIIGGAKERDIGALIKSAVGGDSIRDLTGQTSLPQAIALLAQAACVVSNDSGLMHVAAAVGRPLVALYGSSSPERTPPLSPQARILHTDIECRPCFKRDCPLGHTDCLVKLDVARVEAAVLSQLAAIT